MGCPFVKDSGMGLPCCLANSGLLSNNSRWLGPPAMTREMTRLALGGTCVLGIKALHFSGSAALVDAISDERAKAPTPRHVCPRNVRRCRRRMVWRLEFILIVGWC